MILTAKIFETDLHYWQIYENAWIFYYKIKFFIENIIPEI